MPSFTFVSTANAFVLRGATPVFVDIRDGHAQPRRALVEAAITPGRKAIVPVHYAGVGCEMDALAAIAARPRPLVIEDAAQALMRDYRGRPLGSFGDARRAQLPRDQERHLRRGRRAARQRRRAGSSAPRSSARRAPNRSRFFRGQVDKYTWVDVGSSYAAERDHRGIPLGAARGRPTRSRARGWRSGTRTTRRSPTSSSASGCAGRSCRPTARTTRTCTTSCSRSSRRATRFIAHLDGAGRQRRLPLRAAPLVAGRRRYGAGRRRARA